MVVNKTEEHLQSLGLSSYEAKAYLSLLRDSPVSAYELAKNSGIPSSKIYEVVERLRERGALVAMQQGDKIRYAPLPARDFLAGLRRKVEDDLDAVEQGIAALDRSDEFSYLWAISDAEELKRQLSLAVSGAKKTIMLSAWIDEARQIDAELSHALESGVHIALLLFGPGTLPRLETTRAPETAQPSKAGHEAGPRLFGEGNLQIYRHPIEDTIYAERGGRGLTLVVDQTRALMATIPAGGRSIEGGWSLNRGFVTLAEDYIKHDIYLMKIVERMDEQLTRTFGSGYRLLRDIFHDTDTTNNATTGGSV